MTSNIEKLNAIAPVLEGCEIDASGNELDDIYNLYGMFHSIEIDVTYLGSEAVVYFRATEARKKLTTLTPERTWKETWEEIGDAELAFPVSKLESVDVKANGRMIFIQFYPWHTREDTTLVFTRRF